MLKTTKIELELIWNIDVHYFMEKEMRRSISYIDKRYSKVSNKYMKLYDPNKPSKYITYLDANNLCGSAINQYRPYDGFK